MGVVSVAFVYRGAIVAQLSAWRVLPEPERLTELYFTDFAALPKSLVAGSRHTVAFTVRNLEHRATVYHYRVVAKSGQDAEQSLGDGTFMLNHDGAQNTKADIVVPAAQSDLAVKVELYYQGITPNNVAETMQTQSINFSATVKIAGTSEARSYAYAA